MCKKSFWAVLAAACMIFDMAGCRYNEIPVNYEHYETTSEANDETNINYITDWSLDEMVKSIEMNGVTYSMPFTVNDLGDKYSLEWVSVDFEESGKVDHYIFALTYCDVVYAVVEVYDPFDFNDMDNYKITSISLLSDADFKFGGISGIGCEYTKGDILKIFGVPSNISSEYNMFAYMFDEGDDNHQNNMVVVFNDDEVLEMISIGYYK